MVKAVLVHVNGSARSAGRIEVAPRLAMAHDACLIGAASAGIAPVVLPVGGLDPGMPFVTYSCDEMRAQANSALPAFERQVRAEGMANR